MANRVLRDWTTSEVVDSISPNAEVFFTRLIMKADDYGSFHANPKLINSALFPLKDYKIDKIMSWINECYVAGLLFLYEVDGKRYLRINNFGQRLRNMRNTFPQPENNSQQLAADVGESPPETETKQKRNETETETETETDTADAEVTVWPAFDDFWIKYDKKTSKTKCEKKWAKINQGAREQIMRHLDEYIPSTPDRAYRKNPETYLTNESWNDEIIQKNGNSKHQNNINSLKQAFANDVLRGPNKS